MADCPWLRDRFDRLRRVAEAHPGRPVLVIALLDYREAGAGGRRAFGGSVLRFAQYAQPRLDSLGWGILDGSIQGYRDDGDPFGNGPFGVSIHVPFADTTLAAPALRLAIPGTASSLVTLADVQIDACGKHGRIDYGAICGRTIPFGAAVSLTIAEEALLGGAEFPAFDGRRWRADPAAATD